MSKIYTGYFRRHLTIVNTVDISQEKRELAVFMRNLFGVCAHNAYLCIAKQDNGAVKRQRTAVPNSNEKGYKIQRQARIKRK